MSDSSMMIGAAMLVSSADTLPLPIAKSRGVDLGTGSILLGHQNIAVTQKHYAPWVASRQAALEEAVMKAWE